jgi:hypothetical protein
VGPDVEGQGERKEGVGRELEAKRGSGARVGSKGERKEGEPELEAMRGIGAGVGGKGERKEGVGSELETRRASAGSKEKKPFQLPV